MLLKINYGAKDKKQFDEIHVDLPGLKPTDPTLFASIKYVNSHNGRTSSEQLVPVTELCDPIDPAPSSTSGILDAEIISEEPIKHEENKSPKRKPAHN